MTILTLLFWISVGTVFYAYLGYPIVLYCISRIINPHLKEKIREKFYPTLSIIIPAYNEGKVLEEKIANTLGLSYPEENREILIISDGSTDNTDEVARKFLPQITYAHLEKRGGKASALNMGLKMANNEILVFTDASIMLETDALENIVSAFKDPQIGCISGEDHILGEGGEGLYGKYELFLRNLESRVHSIVGASGSFYAQRKMLCRPFEEGMAPDFLSVLNTREQGYFSITEPSAKGTMTAIKSARGEFGRKIRTIVRGMTALFHKSSLLNPLRFPLFSFIVFSHKIVRWLVPFFLISTFITSLFLAQQSLYFVFFLLQIVFYSFGLCSFFKKNFFKKLMIPKISLYFLLTNIAIVVAWWKYLQGVRQEIWAPTER